MIEELENKRKKMILLQKEIELFYARVKNFRDKYCDKNEFEEELDSLMYVEISFSENAEEINKQIKRLENDYYDEYPQKSYAEECSYMFRV